MRIVHTSDWHLGRRLHGESLAESHEKFLQWLHSEVLTDIRPDLLVVAGDIYDRGVPPTDAIELMEETLVEIQKQGITVLISAGNHDSRVRLGSNTRFMSGLGLHFRTRLNDVDQPVVIEKDDFTLLAYGIPYLEPDVDAGPAEHQWQVSPSQSAVLEEAIRRIRLDVDHRQQRTSKPIRTLVSAHAFVQGASASDSERNIKDVKVGGLGQADAQVFAGIDYVALGHIHRPHAKNEIAGPGSTLLRYSGSPAPFSFSERKDEKQVLVVEMSSDGVKDSGIQSLLVPQVRGMVQIEGTLEEILGDRNPASDAWTKIVLTDNNIPINIFDTLKRKFPHLLDLETRVTTDGLVSRDKGGLLLQDLTPEEVTKRFVARVTQEEVTSDVSKAIDDCCASIRVELSQVNK